MTAVFINPGSGPAQSYGRVRIRSAVKNMREFVRELDIPRLSFWLLSKRQDDGRYSFMIRRGKGKTCRVDMPGLVISQVRYRMDTEDNPWKFPRLFIGKYGSSWLWPFAINDARDELTYAFERGKEDE